MARSFVDARKHVSTRSGRFDRFPLYLFVRTSPQPDPVASPSSSTSERRFTPISARPEHRVQRRAQPAATGKRKGNKKQTAGYGTLQEYMRLTRGTCSVLDAAVQA